MKLFATFLSVFFLATITIGQTEATIKFEINMSTDNPELKAQLAMMEGSTMSMYLKDGNMRQEVSMGGFMTNTTITNTETNETLLLADGMMGKFAAKTKTMDESQSKKTDGDLDIELVDETKVIAGVTCKKAIVYDKGGNENIFWYTEDYEAPKNGGKFLKDGVPGMALEFSLIQPQVTMTFSATEFSKKVKNPKEKFDMKIPEGYTEKSIEEFQNLLGSAQ